MYLKKISEEIIRRYEAGNPTAGSELNSKEVQLLVVQEVNRRLKLEHAQIHLPLGESVPPHAAIATYDIDFVDLIESSKRKSVCTQLDSPFPGSYWVTPEGQYWTESAGNYWVYTGHECTITVAQDVSNTKLFTVTFAGMTAPDGISFADIVTFLTTTGEGYFELVGSVGTPLTAFSFSGVSNLAATADGFSFTYNIDLATIDQYTDIVKKVQPTNIAIKKKDGITDNIEVINIRKCLFEVIPVYSDKSKATLPTQPINLPRGMGVWKLFSESDPWTSFVPVSSGEMFLYNGRLNGAIDDINVYEYHDNKTLILNKSIADIPTDMKIQLLVVDPEQLEEYDLLPIPADMEMEVIMSVLQMIQPQRVSDETNDNNQNIR